MRIIISKSFNKKYLQKLSKYFSVWDFSKCLLKNRKDILLKYPHIKIKLQINSVAFRWVILIQEEKYIIPLIFCPKKDKQCGDNIIWNKYEKIILSMQEKVLEDIEGKDYEVYDDFWDKIK